MSGGGGEGLTSNAAFVFLLGTWTVVREIQGQARMSGWAEVLEKEDGTAVYRERVAVTMMDGAEFGGSQSYLVRKTGEGFDLLFAETGTIFQELRFCCKGGGGSLRAEATHLCGEDRYLSDYVLGPGRCFSIRHIVAGPRKRYTSITTFVSATDVRQE